MAKVILKIDKNKIILKNVSKADKTMLKLKSEIAKDTEKYVPFRQGALRRSVDASVRDSGKRLAYNSLYAAFQYGGKVMVGVNSGKAWARKYEKKRVTNKDLTYSQPGSGKEWWKISKNVNIHKWIRYAKKVFKNAK